MPYPQHEKYKAEEDKLTLIRDFIEWFIENGPKDDNYKCRAFECLADERVPLHRLQDAQKEKLILEFAEIDYDDFYFEKDRMLDVQRLFNDGFDSSYYTPEDGEVTVGCTCCQAVVVNGTPCHEHGCPNRSVPHHG
jgi:hypothetical protein